MNNALIIGHTSGIGAGLIYNTPYYITKGVSRSTGYDVNNNNTKFDYSEYSVIILNAYGDFTSQLKTLYNIVENPTFNKKTLIVVISSIKAWNSVPTDLSRSKYAVEKNALNKASSDLNFMGYSVMTVCPSYVETEFNKNKKVPMLSVDYVANLIWDKITEFHIQGILTKEIIIERVK